MTISTEQDQVDFTTWYKLWEAAVAINAMCIRHGKAGYWDGIGESDFFHHLCFPCRSLNVHTLT